MTLDEYLRRFGEDSQAFAFRAGVSLRTVRDVRAAHAVPNVETARRIERATAGLVRVLVVAETTAHRSVARLDGAA